MSAPRPSITVECYARTAPLGTSVEGTLDTLREYRDQGVIKDVSLEAWPDEAVLEGYTEETPIVVRYRRFRSWAEEAGVSLRPAFTVRERGSLIDDRTHAVLVLPECCLAVYVDGELATVAPHRTGTTTYAVEDALADLGRPDGGFPADPPTADPADPPATPASAAGRPE